MLMYLYTMNATYIACDADRARSGRAWKADDSPRPAAHADDGRSRGGRAEEEPGAHKPASVGRQ